MTHELLYLKDQSRDTLSLVLIGSGLSTMLVIGFALFIYWQGRHARAASRLARERLKAARKRRRR